MCTFLVAAVFCYHFYFLLFVCSAFNICSQFSDCTHFPFAACAFSFVPALFVPTSITNFLFVQYLYPLSVLACTLHPACYCTSFLFVLTSIQLSFCLLSLNTCCHSLFVPESSLYLVSACPTSVPTFSLQLTTFFVQP